MYESAGVKTDSGHASHPLEGYWSVTCLSSGALFSLLGLCHFVLSVASDGSITGRGEAYVGKLLLKGTTAKSIQGSSTYSLKLNMFVDNKKVDYFLHGVHNTERDIVTGSWDVAHSPQKTPPAPNTFSMRRTPADIHQIRHDLKLGLETNSSILSRNRWRFAIEATLFRVQSKNFSWKYVQARFAKRRLWLDLTIAFWQKQLPEDRIHLMCALTGVYAPWNSRLYEAIAAYLYARRYAFRMYVLVSLVDVLNLHKAVILFPVAVISPATIVEKASCATDAGALRA